MASSARACTKSAMTSLLSSRLSSATIRRNYSILSTTAANTNNTTPPRTTTLRTPSTITSSSSSRCFSKYISVNHSNAYEQAMKSQHGLQLQLALDEGKGKDDAPFDPFSQFLDEMGYDPEDLVDEEDEDEDEFDGEMEGGEKYDEDDEDGSAATSPSPLYARDGSVIRPASQRSALRVGYPSGGNFAVIHLSGFQHKVTNDDLLVVNKLKPIDHWSVGSTHTLTNEDILLMGNKGETLVGLPGVVGGEVDVMVEEITRDKTVVVFKKRRRKNSRRKNGFRREVTFLRVLDVRMPGEVGKEVEGSGEVVSRVAA